MRVFRPESQAPSPLRASSSRRLRRAGLGSVTVLALSAAGLSATPAFATGSADALADSAVAPAAAITPVTRAAIDPALVTGRGADVRFAEQEAENAVTNGEILAPSRAAYTLPSEASGRSAVKLDAPGEYVDFTLPARSNAINIRYALPDAPTGGGITAPLDVVVNGRVATSVTLTSQFSWLYGMYPFSNNPEVDPNPGWWKPEPDPVTKPFRPFHFFTEQRVLLPGTLKAGQTVRLQLPAGSTVPWAVIDLMDSEFVPAAGTQPRGSVSVTDFGADATGATDSADAFDAAIAAAHVAKKHVWIPAGTFQVNRHIIVDDITVKGAGNWRTTVTGEGVGFYGKYVSDGGSTNVHLSDFAIIGNIRDRQDDLQLNGIGGAIGGNSVIERLYIQHTKVGMWFDGPFSRLKVQDNIIVDQIADALNLRLGISRVIVRNNFIRNTGDDGLAMWSPKTTGNNAADSDNNNEFAHNTVQSPTLANGIAIYGGRDNKVEDNLVADPVREGSALHAGSRFGSTPFTGTLTFARNTTVRGGTLDLNWNIGLGAIWFYALEASIDARIDVIDSSFLDNTYDAFMFVAEWGVKDLYSISNVHFTNILVDGTGTSVVNARAAGWADFTNVDVRNIGAAGINNCGTFHFTGTSEFDVRLLSGNDGWPATTTCDDRPPRVAPPAPSPWTTPAP